MHPWFYLLALLDCASVSCSRREAGGEMRVTKAAAQRGAGAHLLQEGSAATRQHSITR